jgi:hypothetical protein
MANIEIRHLDFGDRVYKKEKIGIVDENVFNLSAPVGKGMANHFGDVMVIQAMLNVIASDPTWAEYNGLKPSAMPGVMGRFDHKTEMAIQSFQEARRYNLLRVDGIVHPGSFGNRILKLSGTFMTITLLNDQAGEVCSFKYNSLDHTKEIARIYPQVVAAVYL